VKIPLVDLVAQYDGIKKEVDEAIESVLRSGNFILGPNVAALERELEDYLGVQYALGVASGTDALVLALRAVGIRPGDEVIVPANTFFATAEAVSSLGATPVFIDIDPQTYCLDLNQLEVTFTSRTKAIIPVHLYGHPSDMDPILQLANGRDIKVIEDNAQAIGAEYRGRKTGSMGHAGCLSFFPSKNLGGYGDGGMVVTDDVAIADRVRKLRTHGWEKKHYPEMVGYNSRLDELQAAVLRVKLHYLNLWNDRRRTIAEKYKRLLAGKGLEVPFEAPYAKHVYHLYILRTKERESLQARLRSLGIASGIYYPQPLHLLEPYKNLGYHPGEFPETQQAA